MKLHLDFLGRCCLCQRWLFLQQADWMSSSIGVRYACAVCICKQILNGKLTLRDGLFYETNKLLSLETLRTAQNFMRAEKLKQNDFC